MYDGFFDIEEELKKLPDKPGVYIMHDEKDEIIYVGKAISLKNRVRQYFQSSRNHTNKIKQMVSNIRRFEYIITDSELEALVLECNLIKLHRPRYNTMLKDDKTYPFIKITGNEPFPRIISSREMKRDKARYFGPFTSGKAVNDTIELLNKTYGIRTCRRNLPKDTGKERPCLNYHIGQCTAPCQGYISQEDYGKLIDQCIDFLEGRYNGITRKLTGLMYEASEKMEFEQAAAYRNMLESVKFVSQKQKITNSDMQDRDIVAASIDYKDCVVQVFFIRNGKMIGREHYHMRLAGDEKRSEIITDFIKQYYAGTPYIPPEIMLQENLIDEELIGRWLTERAGHNVKFLVPKRGQKEKLVELAEKNANMVLNQDREKILKEEARTTGAVKEIERLTGLHDIHRMEAFDIKPDLIMMDGGKGQVNIALEVLNDLNISIPVCGMVKDDNHRTRALWYNGKEVEINTGSEAFKLITRIQDEAHRFAIEFHRNLRSREQVKSILDDIDGIGPVRRKALMKHFKDIDVIKKASVEELCDVPSMNLAAAEKVHEFFNKQERGT